MRITFRDYDDSIEMWDSSVEGEWYTMHWFEALVNFSIKVIGWSLIWAISFWLIPIVGEPFIKVIKESGICTAPLQSEL